MYSRGFVGDGRLVYERPIQRNLASPMFVDFTTMPPMLCLAGGDEELLHDSARLVRNAGMAGVNATLHVAAGMQHVWPIWAGAFPEADAAVKLIGDWIIAHTP
jgi:epsilon-lactone hydrolase